MSSFSNDYRTITYRVHQYQDPELGVTIETTLSLTASAMTAASTTTTNATAVTPSSSSVSDTVWPSTYYPCKVKVKISDNREMQGGRVTFDMSYGDITHLVNELESIRNNFQEALVTKRKIYINKFFGKVRKEFVAYFSQEHNNATQQQQQKQRGGYRFVIKIVDPSSNIQMGVVNLVPSEARNWASLLKDIKNNYIMVSIGFMNVLNQDRLIAEMEKTRANYLEMMDKQNSSMRRLEQAVHLLASKISELKLFSVSHQHQQQQITTTRGGSSSGGGENNNVGVTYEEDDAGLEEGVIYQSYDDSEDDIPTNNQIDLSEEDPENVSNVEGLQNFFEKNIISNLHKIQVDLGDDMNRPGTTAAATTSGAATATSAVVVKNEGYSPFIKGFLSYDINKLIDWVFSNVLASETYDIYKYLFDRLPILNNEIQIVKNSKNFSVISSGYSGFVKSAHAHYLDTGVMPTQIPIVTFGIRINKRETPNLYSCVVEMILVFLLLNKMYKSALQYLKGDERVLPEIQEYETTYFVFKTALTPFFVDIDKESIYEDLLEKIKNIETNPIYKSFEISYAKITRTGKLNWNTSVLENVLMVFVQKVLPTVQLETDDVHQVLGRYLPEPPQQQRMTPLPETKGVGASVDTITTTTVEGLEQKQEDTFSGQISNKDSRLEVYLQLVPENKKLKQINKYKEITKFLQENILDDRYYLVKRVMDLYPNEINKNKLKKLIQEFEEDIQVTRSRVLQEDVNLEEETNDSNDDVLDHMISI